MGQGPGLGLGLALAQRERGVIVVNGDGCTLRNLGALVTLASQPANLYLRIIDNGLYEVTGGQVHAGAGRVDFAGLARAAGVWRAYAFEAAEFWHAGTTGGASRSRTGLVGAEGEWKFGQETPETTRAAGAEN